jgi:hypothetical protein
MYALSPLRDLDVCLLVLPQVVNGRLLLGWTLNQRLLNRFDLLRREHSHLVGHRLLELRGKAWNNCEL